MKPFLFAANWKMYLSAQQEHAFCMQHTAELVELTQTHNVSIALFPSFVSLQEISKQLHPTPIKLGAQDCSPHPQGAFTGQVSALSLAETGCSYTIVGHSERRALGESSTDIAQKAQQLFQNNIQPIICIGETRDEYEKNKTSEALARQLAPLVPILALFPQNPFYIAYEPVWAIGTGVTPTPHEIDAAFKHIQSILQQAHVQQAYSFLYGGSVTASLALQLYTIPQLEGFLIGGASIDFQELKKIVLSKHS